MSLPRYESYRNSGEPLLGDLPRHWAVKRLRFVADLNPSKSEIADLPDTTEVTFLPMEAIGEAGSLDLSRTRTLAEVKTGYSYVTDGDVIFAKVTPCFENGKGAILHDLIDGVGFGTTELTVLRPHHPSDAPFLWWLISSSVFRKPAEGEMTGAGGLKRVPDEFVASFPTPWPTPAERIAIAVFLDRETAKIDALVEAQRRLIELLKEKRQAVISHAVTKGLDPTAPMKDSGVEWLGEVPEHWSVAPLKRAAKVLPGFAFPSAGFSHDSDNTRLLRGVNVGVGVIKWDELVYWDRQQNDGLDCYELSSGDVVLGMDRPWIGDGLRVAAIKEQDAPCLLLQRVAAVRPRQGHVGDYLLLLLSHPAFFHHCAPEMTGVSVPHISGSQVEEYEVGLPPFEEQREIAISVAARTQSFNSLIDTAYGAITLLQERRSALISAAVTGKINVRGLAAAPAPAELKVA